MCSTASTSIAAVARANGVAIYSQDADLDGIPGVEVVRV
jgi:predicted nucleic acid-binding protein